MKPENHRAYLPDLIGLCLATVSLKIDQILDTRLDEYVVAASDSFFESQIDKKPAKVIEANVGIGLTVQNALEKPLSPRHAVYPIPSTPCHWHPWT